jgi:hypothetical protein
MANALFHAEWAAGPCVALAECRRAFFAIAMFGAAPRLHGRGLSVRMIRIPDSELQRLDGLQPIVGIPVGSFIETALRTVMRISYSRSASRSKGPFRRR